MKFSPIKWTGTALMAGFLVGAQAERAFSQASPDPGKPQALPAASPEQSQALLQMVKQSEMDRRIALKQTEIDRLKEDLEKSKRDLDASQKNLGATNAMIAESNANMDKLAAERKRLQQQLDLTDLRIEAEQKEGDGLKRLSAAQTSELEAINQRMAEIDVRSRLRQSEVALLSDGKQVPGEDNDEKGTADFYKLKKTLASDELKTVSTEAVAREAMKAASARLALAQAAAAHAKQVSDAMEQGNNLPPVAEKSGGASPAAKASPSPSPKLHKKGALKKAAAPASTASVSPSPKSKGSPWWEKQGQ